MNNSKLETIMVSSDTDRLFTSTTKCIKKVWENKNIAGEKERERVIIWPKIIIQQHLFNLITYSNFDYCVVAVIIVIIKFSLLKKCPYLFVHLIKYGSSWTNILNYFVVYGERLHTVNYIRFLFFSYKTSNLNENFGKKWIINMEK